MLLFVTSIFKEELHRIRILPCAHFRIWFWFHHFNLHVVIEMAPTRQSGKQNGGKELFANAGEEDHSRISIYCSVFSTIMNWSMEKVNKILFLIKRLDCFRTKAVTLFIVNKTSLPSPPDLPTPLPTSIPVSSSIILWVEKLLRRRSHPLVEFPPSSSYGHSMPDPWWIVASLFHHLGRAWRWRW